MKIIKKTFSLIELLVVIVVISILMGILLPVVNSVRTNAKKAKAKGEINAIVTAIKQYEATYGYLPVCGWYEPTDLTKYRQFIEMLTGYDGPDGDTQVNNGTYGNPRNIRFLDVPGSYGTDDSDRGGLPSGAEEPGKIGDYVDPWGGIYMIYLDTSYGGGTPYDGKVSVNGENLNGAVFVYSLGPDGKHNPTGDYGTGENKDNICSWK
jgi:prepilin-type N-terminal cleavage/methylation domain-containing protein